MGFRINTNVAAMNAHRNAGQNNVSLDKSLQSLSSGLRINTAADDASGLAIANQLRAQSTGLGQAINNANDGVGVAQTADGALEEYENIVNTVRTKAIQAASDGQNSDSRSAIQNDIDKLLEEAQNIATTTSFNGQQLLDGTYQNKAFHIGAYKDETVDMSISSTQTNAVGSHVNNEAANSVNDDPTNRVASVAFDSTFAINGVATGVSSASTVAGDNTVAHSAGSAWAKASAINSVETATGVHATAKTDVAGVNVNAGSLTAGDLVINGVDIGSLNVDVSDVSNTLMNAINKQSEETGVVATHDGAKMSLTSNDGSTIKISTANQSQAITGLGLTGETQTTGSTNVAAATLAAGDLTINGVDIGPVVVAANDGTNTLVGAINAKSAETGVTAVNDNGKMVLSSAEAVSITTANNSEASTGLSAGQAGTIVPVDGDQFNAGKLTLTAPKDVRVQESATGSSGFGKASETFTVSSGHAIDQSDVTTREAANNTILTMDIALKDLDKIRSNIGSTQNQLESTVRNISVTQVNVAAAESQIRDVDFAAESANFAKHNILAQSGSYAMSQANAVQQNVMRLLQ
ncbi:flagellin [Sulfurimonas sp.]|uniref:flagellin N-terminal helical domain-containing protein n=1 Tax=Sulfurimonas sp. TaxID=2022749 RepID=UPI0025D45953|nr:flagellin [Sulfurimonas sp.]